MHIISGSSNPTLAANLVTALQAQHPQSRLINCQIEKFANDEKKIRVIDEDLVRGQQICLVQSFSAPVDEMIIETLLIVDALERLGAKEVSLIVPWMGYSLQDKVFREGEAIAAKVVADMLSNSFISRIFLLELHNTSIPGFFAKPTYHLSTKELFQQHLREYVDLSQAVVVSPDFGGLKRARYFANSLNLPLLNIDKSRDLQSGQVTAHAIHGGDVQDKIVILYDDVIVTGGTVAETSLLLKEHGAKQIYFLATHGIFCNQGLDKIIASPIDQVIISDSIRQQQESPKLVTLSLAPLLATALQDWI